MDDASGKVPLVPAGAPAEVCVVDADFPDDPTVVETACAANELAAAD